jgi:adenine deaminase
LSDNRLSHLIDVAAGRASADLLFKNAAIVNVISHEIERGSLAISGDRIVGIGDYDAKKVVDLAGKFVCPGLIDAHVHIESSLLFVPQFASVVSAHGTTAVVADPHEFANVMGIKGIETVLSWAGRVPIEVFVTLSSCVPASCLETAGAILSADDLRQLVDHPRVLGLAEMMNYPGVIAGQADVLRKISMIESGVIDGHAPSVKGRELTAYAASGIMSDHECVTAEEARAKLRSGLHIMVREGSQTRNLEALLPAVTPETADRFMFCTDDKDVRHLLDEGQIDHMIRKAIGLGLDPISAVRLGTHNAARYFNLRQMGAVLPGYFADLAVVEDLKAFRVLQTYHRGRLVAEDGRSLFAEAESPAADVGRDTIRIHAAACEDFAVPCPAGTNESNPPRIHVIQVLENRIDTERTIEASKVQGGQIVADASRDLAKMVVIERHRASGEVGRGFVRGFGLRSGAIASSVAHDAHNIIVVGMADADMHHAVKRLVELGGGLVATQSGKVLAEVPLPIAGLVSDEPAEVVAGKLHRLCEAAREMGCGLEQPFMALSFLSLSVIGKLKLTNQGLIDVEQFKVIPLIAGVAQA